MKRLIAAALLSLGMLSNAQAGVIVTIQPSADLNDIVWTVSWDSLAGNVVSPTGTYNWDAMDPATGAVIATAPWGSNVRQIAFVSIGDPFGVAYNNGGQQGFGDGVGGVSSSPADWGVGPNNNGVGTGDYLLIFNTLLNTTDPFPTSGSFVLTVPGANLSNYNIGTHTNDPNVSITVTDTPFSAVPEPSSLILLGIGCCSLCGYGLRRKRQQAA
jgi:hypothetical protein